MYGLSKLEAASLRERLADADFETLIDLSFEDVALSRDEVAEADEALALFDRKEAA